MSYLGNSPGVASQRVVTTFVATDGQTYFVPQSGYTLGYLDVYRNGIKLINGVDYTADNGTDFTLTSGAVVDDNIEAVSFTARGLSDGYTKAEADTRFLEDTNSGVTAGSYGSSSQVPVFTVDSRGLITSASETAVAGVSSTSFDSTTGVLTINTSDGGSHTADLGIGTADSPTFAAATVNGNIIVTGTVDGRDVAVDGTKLDSIENGATADQTGAEIKTAYEGEADTNAFTDAEKTKLSGIEAGADVTDTANVTAAGALMDSEVTNLAQVKAFDSTDYATAAQGTTADSAVQPGDNVSTLTNDASYATTSYVDTAEADARSYADGIVASEAALRSLGDSNTLSSANAYTDSAVAGLVDSSPATLDTLNELAAALGDDPNFATTVSTNIGTKVSKSGDSMTGNLSFGDNDKAIFGAGSDLQIYHDGSHSYVKDAGTGNLVLQGANVEIYDGAGDTLMLNANNNAGVGLWYAGSNKLATTSTGIDVTGTATMDGLTLNSGGFDYINSGSFLYTNVPTGYSTTIQAGGLNVASFASGGDISFYEDTGTTAKFFWDASAESLGIGTSSPVSTLTLPNDGMISWASTACNIQATSSGADYIKFTTNSNEAMRIDSSGNVGIGTDSPSTKLEVKGKIGIGTPATYTGGSDVGGHIIGNHASNNTAQAGMIIAGGGSSDINHSIFFRVGYDDTIDTMDFHEYGNFRFYTGGSIGSQDLRMTIDSAGHIGFGQNGGIIGAAWRTTDGFRIISSSGTGGYMEHVRTTTSDASANMYFARQEFTNGRIFSFNTSTAEVGSVTINTSGTTYNTTSDRRLKDNIVTITDGKEKLLAMNPVTHTWIADPDAPAVHGFIAQEMKEVVPEAVSGDPESDTMMSMDYGRITPVIVAALQDALKEIEELKTRINELEVK